MPFRCGILSWTKAHKNCAQIYKTNICISLPEFLKLRGEPWGAARCRRPLRPPTTEPSTVLMSMSIDSNTVGSQSTRSDVARHADTPKLSATTRTIHRHGALTLDAVQLAQAEALVPLRSTAAAHMFALSGRASKPRGGPRWPLFRPCKVMAQHASRHSSRGGREHTSPTVWMSMPQP